MPSSSCGKCFQGTIYVVLSSALAALAVFSAYQINKTYKSSSPTNESSSSCATNLSAQLILFLRKSGYNLLSNLLLISPQCLLPPLGGTLFAVADPAMREISLPAPAKTDLLRYHISPRRLVLEDLLQYPLHSCIPTLLERKNIAITKTDPRERTVEINQVPISHPDIYTDGPYVIHGILVPFFSPGPEGGLSVDGDLIPESSCNASSSLSAGVSMTRDAVQWPLILHLLSWNGFLSFSIGLQTVLDGIAEEFDGLRSVTVFAPRECDLSCFPLVPQLLEHRIMLHVLPRRFSYRDLVQLPEKALLRTLTPGQDLQITSANDFAHALSINGVEVIEPDIILYEAFVIHGISRAFENIKIST